MYRADHLGVLYFGADLPDGVSVFYSLGTITIIDNEIFSKNGTKYESPTSNMEMFVQDNLIWLLEGTVIHPEYGEIFISYGRPCLFNEEYPFQTPTEGEQANASITDRFADTYIGTYVNPDLTPSGLPTFTFNRLSLCEWRAFVNGVEFVLSYGEDPNIPYSGWFMNGVPKTIGLGVGQFQNTPTGIYDWSGIGETIIIS